MWELPCTRKEWVDRREKYQCDTWDVHTLESASSASEVKKEQYLALKVLWRQCSQKKIYDFLSKLGFDSGEFEGKVNYMMKSSEPWKEYVRVVEENYSATLSGKSKPWTRNSVFRAGLGRFEVAYMDQLEVVELPSSSEEYDLPKVDVTPRWHFRDRSKPPVYYSETPVTPSPNPRGFSFEDLESRSARQRDSGEPHPPNAQDESMVNSALVNLLHAIWIDEPREANWTSQRKALKFESKSGGPGFAARTDGHLKVQSYNDRSAALLEVKARIRPRDTLGTHNVTMQESAQMALWIAQEPDNHWTCPRQGEPQGKDRGKGKGKQARSQQKF
jgi:hypothetical protein